jgi:hypothetical protein
MARRNPHTPPSLAAVAAIPQPPMPLLSSNAINGLLPTVATAGGGGGSNNADSDSTATTADDGCQGGGSSDERLAFVTATAHHPPATAHISPATAHRQQLQANVGGATRLGDDGCLGDSTAASGGLTLKVYPGVHLRDGDDGDDGASGDNNRSSGPATTSRRQHDYRGPRSDPLDDSLRRMFSKDDFRLPTKLWNALLKQHALSEAQIGRAKQLRRRSKCCVYAGATRKKSMSRQRQVGERARILPSLCHAWACIPPRRQIGWLCELSICRIECHSLPTVGLPLLSFCTQTLCSQLFNRSASNVISRF